MTNESKCNSGAVKRGVRWSCLCATGLLMACATSESFRPSERATATSPQGYPAADYDVDTPEGQIGDVKVFSQGTSRVQLESATDRKKLTTIHVGFTIENRGDEELRLDTKDLFVDVRTEKDRVIRDLQPARVDGTTKVSPGADKTIDTYFLLPEGIKATGVHAFRVRWQVVEGGNSYKQRTPFLEAPQPYPYSYYYSPYFDPFLYAPYGYPGPFAFYPYPYYRWF